MGLGTTAKRENVGSPISCMCNTQYGGDPKTQKGILSLVLSAFVFLIDLSPFSFSDSVESNKVESVGQALDELKGSWNGKSSYGIEKNTYTMLNT